MTPKSLIEPARHAGTALLRSQPDARLVDLTRDGNERAFEAIVQRYRRPLLRYCARLLPLARAEDAVQQTFLSAHRAIHAGDAELNLRPWLYRIAHNASLNLLRQQGFDHEQVSEQIDGVETPPQAFERGERLRSVVAAVQELPERQRSAIVLQAVDGRSYDEIASELGVTDGAVRQLLNRARTTLREGVGVLTPGAFLTRLAASGGEASSAAERVAGALAGAGGSALLAKAGAAIVVAGAVAGGAAVGGLPGGGGSAARGDGGRASAAAVVAQARGTAAATSGPARGEHLRLVDQRVTRHGDRPGRHHSGAGDDRGSHGGPGSDDGGTGGDDRSGSSGGDAGSGSGDDGGTSGSGSGSSGSGSGDDGTSGSGSSSGSGSGSSDDGGTSGSGSGTSDGGSTSGGGTSGSGSGTSDGGGTSGGSGTSGGTSGSGDTTAGDDALTDTTSGSDDGGGTSRSGRR